MKKWLIAGAGAAGLLISSVALARVDVGISIGVPGVVYPAPVYAAPAPVYVAPAPVYAPRPRLLPSGARLRGAPGGLSGPGLHPRRRLLGSAWPLARPRSRLLSRPRRLAPLMPPGSQPTAINTKATLASGLFPQGNFRYPREGTSGDRGLDGFARRDGGRLLRHRDGLACGPTRRFLNKIDPTTRSTRRPPPTIMRTHAQTPVHR